MHGLRLGGFLVPSVELVVEGPGAVHRRDVLRDAREVDRQAGRVPKHAREFLGEIRAAVEPEDRHDATGDERLHDLSVCVALAVPVR